MGRRFPANCFIVGLTVAALGKGEVRFTRNRRRHLHCYWVDQDGMAWEFYTKGASSASMLRNTIRIGEIKRCPSFDEANPRRLAREKRNMNDKHLSDRKVIVVVNGYPQSGKDTFVSFAMAALNALGWNAVSTSSIDPVKAITRKIGIPDEPKTPEKRALWAEINAALEKYDWLITRRMMDEYQRYMRTMHAGSGRPQITFMHVREPDTIRFMQTIKEECEFVTVFVDRPDAERVTSNSSDMNVEGYEYRHRVGNDGDLPNLRVEADLFANMINGALL
jgi:hypothetical protein